MVVNVLVNQLGFISIGDLVIVMTHRLTPGGKDRYNKEAIVELVDIGFSMYSSESKRYYIRFSDGMACWTYRTDFELESRLSKRLAERIVLLQRIDYALDTNNQELFDELSKQLSEGYYEVN